jgi:DNA-binding response OmpR family regulator
MQLRNPAIADIAVVTAADSVFAEVSSCFTSEDATISRRDWPADSTEAVAAWARPDVVVLDLAHSAETDRRIGYLRRRWPTLQIVVINAASESESLRLLSVGADDVIIEGSVMFAARLKAVGRRVCMVNASARIAVGDIVFDREARRVWCAGQEVQMSPREFSVLDCLFWKAPKVVSLISLADFVWGDAAEKPRRGVVEVYIGYLRKKLAASRMVVIDTVRGVGYRFAPRV